MKPPRITRGPRLDSISDSKLHQPSIAPSRLVKILTPTPTFLGHQIITEKFEAPPTQHYPITPSQDFDPHPNILGPSNYY